jgi:uncharacterized NAD(P)/FAD-binding protein YdhS
MGVMSVVRIDSPSSASHPFTYAPQSNIRPQKESRNGWQESARHPELSVERPYLHRMAQRSIEADVAIVGGGFSGTLVAIHLLQRSEGRLRVALVERVPPVARGVAYRTPFASHLLNVPAGRMSAWPEDPDHFFRWWRRLDPQSTADDFAPRSLYGRYLHEQLRAATERAPSDAFVAVNEEVLSIAPSAAGAVLRTRGGVTVRASRVVLALGNLAPTNPSLIGAESAAHPAYRRDPWAKGALEGVPDEAPVFLIGTGLTMVDVALALVEQGHRGPIRALSRRGLLPNVHATTAPRATPTLADRSLRGVLEWLRAEAERGDWRAAVDSLREITPQLWMGLSTEEKRRFLRHLRPYWDVHRHRMAPRVSAAIEAMIDRGRLSIEAGKLLSITANGEMLEVAYRPRGTRRVETFSVARVINCTGPGADVARAGEPLLDSLLRAGEIRPDSLGLGLDVTEEGRLRSRSGEPSPTLFAAGPLCRGRTWEATAAPELRVLADQLAAVLVNELDHAESPAAPMGEGHPIL